MSYKTQRPSFQVTHEMVRELENVPRPLCTLSRASLESMVEGLTAEIEQAKRDALPCQVLDVLDSHRKLEAERDALREAIKPWGSGGIITGTVLAWIAAKDPAIAKAIVYGKDAVDRALNP